MKKQALAACAVILLALALSAAPIQSLADQTGEAPREARSAFVPWDAPAGEYVPVAGGDAYELSVCADEGVFRITDAESGEALWYSAMTADTYSELEYSSDKWRAYMTSLLAINYTVVDDTRGNIMNAYAAEKNSTATVLRGQNGIRFEFDFTKLSIRLAMEVSLNGDRLVVHIPADSIYEKGEYVIRSVEVLPFFAAVAKESGADGYLVYPDGCGAISYFDRAEDKSAVAQPIALDIYDTLNLEDTLSDAKPATASLPVYGIKNNDTAVMAAITAGSENAVINVCSAIDNAAVPINRSAFELYYRNEYRIYLSNIKGVFGEVSKTYGTRLDKELQRIDRELTFFLLRGEAACYSGMAAAYRDYLLEEGILKAQPAAQELSLFLAMFMGIKKEDAIIDPFVTMTTYKAVEITCRELLDKGVGALDVLLRGWSKGGYGAYPQSGRAAGSLGGAAGLKALDNLAGAQRDRLNIRLETELLYTNKNRYIAVKGTSLAITDEKEQRFLLSPLKVSEHLGNILGAAKKCDNLSLALSTIGSSLYPDYSDDRYITRTDTVAAWRQAVSNERVSAVQGGNLYSLSSAAYLYDLPNGCSLQQITDRAIPWYYMVVSGILPYVTSAGNRTGDLNKLKLQWIEYGAMPYFELTEFSPKNLRDTAYNVLFTSTAETWKEDALAIYHEMREKLADVTGQRMKEHTYVGKSQVRVSYENGYSVLINYGDEDFVCDGYTAPAGDYVVYAKNT